MPAGHEIDLAIMLVVEGENALPGAVQELSTRADRKVRSMHAVALGLP